MGGSGLDWTDDFQKFCRSGLDCIQLYRIKTGLICAVSFILPHIMVFLSERFPQHYPDTI